MLHAEINRIMLNFTTILQYDHVKFKITFGIFVSSTNLRIFNVSAKYHEKCGFFLIFCVTYYIFIYFSVPRCRLE